MSAGLTSGERMVFAVAFDRAVGAGMRSVQAAYAARNQVERLRLAREQPDVDDDTRAMLDDMLGTGADR